MEMLPFILVGLVVGPSLAAVTPINVGGGTVDVTFGIDDGVLGGNVKVGGASRFEVCNADVESETGLCVKPGTCNDKKSGPVYGSKIGQCDQKDASGNPMECCKVVSSCGDHNSALISYYQNPSYPDTDRDDLACNIKIGVRKKVCQVRVDFLEFELPAPNQKGRCDSKNNMAIMAPSKPRGLFGRGSQGKLCGLNTGNHLYIPARAGDSIQFIATLSGTSAVPLSRAKMAYSSSSAYKWDIKITQIECDDDHWYYAGLKAPGGCLQYYTKVFGTIQSFNFDGNSVMPPNHDYAVCIRDEGHQHGGRTCGITLRALNFGMIVSGEDFPACYRGTEIVNLGEGRECCLARDSSYLGITAGQPDPKHSDRTATRRYWCGQELGTTGQISSKLKPYWFKVHTGNFDQKDVDTVEKKYNPIGFQINYKVDTGIC